jgi:putative flippase GtrA
MVVDTVRRLPRLVRYLMVGTLNTGFSYLIYAVGLFLGLSYMAANLVSCVLGVLFSFKTQGKFVFNDANNPRLWRFIFIWAVLYVLNIGLIKLFLNVGFNAYLGGALALPVMVMLSYFAQRMFVFSLDKS